MKIAKIVSLIVFASACLYACKHEPLTTVVPDPGTGGTGGTGTGSTLVCFQSEVLPIFQSNCAKSGCHDAASHQKGYTLDSYNNIISEGIVPGRATNSKIYKVLFETGSDKMPPPPNADLTSAQKAIIGKWINEGAKNTINCGTTCDTTQFKYGANISVILSTNCTGCHGGTAPSAGINLTNYPGVKNQVTNGRLLGAVTHSPGYSPMPKNAAKLNECQLTQIRKWINAGALNN
ncbi:MAG: c-type cytochrome domain-containing protein [Ferruginibacter sp.]